jgi:hypothetical protein
MLEEEEGLQNLLFFTFPYSDSRSNDAEKPCTTKATKDHEGLKYKGFPSRTFVTLVVSGFAN